MRVLVIGSGGREHALAGALDRSAQVSSVICAPGNPGMATIGECQPVAVGDAGAIADLANTVDADLTVLGAEVPLVAGAVDALTARGRIAFGPTAAGARLEGSKAWMKQLLADAGVPTAQFATFKAGHEAEALAFVETLKGRYVIKTDGLAAGKGVVVTESLTEARDAVRAYLSGAAHGDAGRTVVIEEALSGPELSLLVLCDGRSDPEGAIPLAPAQDFKRLRDGDLGPNTGGHGRVFAGIRNRRQHGRRRDGTRGQALAACVGTPGHLVSRGALRRDHADRRRSEGSRVQRAVR